MTPNISTTLREALFEKPSLPFPTNSTFRTLVPTMFPAGANFVEFLECQETQVQAELAKTILLALAFESPLFPPNKFIINLLDFESHIAEKREGGFVARDHFIHLVHLYLIGLYAFWYHPALQKWVTENIKSSFPTGASHDRQFVMRKCVEAWRTFVLFHDLGYPWEASTQIDDASPYTAPFKDSYRYAAKDSALYVLSQLVAIEWLVGEEGANLGEILNHLRPMTRRSDEFNFSENDPARLHENLGIYQNAQKLPDLGDLSLVHLIQDTLGRENLIPVIESIADGQPCASPQPALDSFLRTRHFPSHPEIPKSEDVEKWVARLSIPESQANAFRLTFYVKDFRTLLDKYQQAVFAKPDGVDYPQKDFSDFVVEFVSKKIPKWPTDPRARFTDYAFAVYRRMFHVLDFDTLDKIPDPFDLHWDLNRKEFESLEGTVLRRVREVIDGKLTERALELKADPNFEFLKINLGEYLKELTMTLRSPKLPARLEDALSDSIRGELVLKRDLYYYYRALRDPILKLLGDTPPFVEGAKPDVVKLGSSEAGRLASDLIQKRGLGSVDTLKNYRPGYVKGNEVRSYIDHGIASGLFMAVIQGGLGKLHQGAPMHLKPLLRRGSNSYPEYRLNAPKDDAYAAEIIYTTLIHNLYPSEMKGDAKQFRTKMRSSSFSFFALFCDNLQHWDRSFLMNLARGHLPYGVNAGNFNIQIVHNQFRITERGPRVETGERQRRLRGQLNEFLENAAHLISLALMEW